MNRTDAAAWVLSLCIGCLRKSQAKTLGELVASALSASRLTLAAIGRESAAACEGAAKHAIKRVARFIANGRIEPVQAMPLIFNRLWRRKLRWHGKRPDRRPLLVSLDWTKVRSFHTLMAAVVVEGRALPLCWESYRDKVQGKSQNALEEGMLVRLQAAFPPEVRLVILADRGFRRASLMQTCQQLKLDYLIRICEDVIVSTDSWSGNLQHFPVRKGMCRGFTGVSYRSDGAATTNLIVRWKRGLPSAKDQPWYLVTSLKLGARARQRQLSDLYALRFDIEELFRDTKNEHLGWSLAKTRVTRPERLDRLIFIAALAYLILTALGLWCRQHCPPRLWASNNRPRELSAYAIGRVMLHRLGVPLSELIRLLLQSLATPDGKWG
jgi:hypothetical protein